MIMIVFYRTNNGKIRCFDDNKRPKIRKAISSLKENSKKKKHIITKADIHRIRAIYPEEFTIENILKLVKYHKQLLQYSLDYNNCNEVACIMKLGDNQRTEFHKGEEGRVKLREKRMFIKLLDNAKDNSLVIIHNHPKGNWFSLGDITNFLNYNSVKTLTIVTNSGKVFFINKTSKYSYEKAFSIIENKTNEITHGTRELTNNEFIDLFKKNMYSMGIDGGQNE